jgi:hypothetical protein
VPHPFDPATEEAHAQHFTVLADLFDRPEHRAICDRLALLVALSEEKAAILRELEQFEAFRSDAPAQPRQLPNYLSPFQTALACG